MNFLKNHLFLALSLLLALPTIGSAQANLTTTKGYLVDRVETPLSITRSQLQEAEKLVDLNKNYKSDWVRKYLSVQVKTTINGRLGKAESDNDILSREQKDNMSKADEGSDISVTISYIPENNLVENDIKEMEFTFQINPEHTAVFADGKQKLSSYLEQNDIRDIIDSVYDKNAMVAVKFTISDEGKIENVHLFETSRDDKTDALLLEIVRNMPSWKPAEYISGRKVKQEMVLTAGNLESCVINLLNFGNE